MCSPRAACTAGPTTTPAPTAPATPAASSWCWLEFTLLLLQCRSSLWFSLSQSLSPVDNCVDHLLSIQLLHLIFLMCLPLSSYFDSLFDLLVFFHSHKCLFYRSRTILTFLTILDFYSSHNCDISLFFFFPFLSKLLKIVNLLSFVHNHCKVKPCKLRQSLLVPMHTQYYRVSRSLAKLSICKERHACFFVALLQHSNVQALLWSTNWLF